MKISYRLIDYFRKMLPDSHMVVVDSHGISGGLEALWNSRWVAFRAYRCLVSILLTRRLTGLVGHLRILNLYAPYRDKEKFLEKLESSYILKIGSLIVEGDLNATVKMNGCWGSF